MLTRAWMGHVSPEWTIRVGGHGSKDEAAGLDPAWADADDRVLVDLCLSGRRDAFGVIVERHRRQVYQLCYRYVGNHEDAADLAQDAFIRAFKGLNGFKGERVSGRGSIGSPSTCVSIGWRSRHLAASRSNPPSESIFTPSVLTRLFCATNERRKFAPPSGNCRRSSVQR